MKHIKLGLIIGAAYGLYVFILEILISFILLNQESTVKTEIISFAAYIFVFTLSGVAAGLITRLTSPASLHKYRIISSIILHLTFLLAYYLLYNALPYNILIKNAGFHLIAIGMFTVIIIGLRFASGKLFLKETLDVRILISRVCGVCGAITAFIVFNLRLEQSPFAHDIFGKDNLLWRIALLGVGVGLYALIKEAVRGFSRAENGVRKNNVIVGLLFTLIFWSVNQFYWNAKLDPTVQEEYSGQDKTNIIFIVIDALRADHLGIYGYCRNTTPNIDGYSSRGTLFTNALTQSSWTKPSVASYFTSRYTGMTTIEEYEASCPSELTMMAELLKEREYYTRGVVANVNLSQRYNYHQGFDDYLFAAGHGQKKLLIPPRLLLYKVRIIEEWCYRYGLVDGNSLYGDAHTVNRAVIPWLKRNSGKNYFLYTHYMEPHYPYYPRKPRYSIGSKFTYEDMLKLKALRSPEFKGTLSNEMISKAINRYDDEIAEADRKIGKLFREFDKLGIWDNTIVILTSDHGEEFLDHGKADHGNSMYHELISVPLLIFLPDGTGKGLVLKERVELLDLLPTIYDYLQFEPPVFYGKSLLPLISNPEDTSWDEQLYFGEVKPIRGEKAADNISAVIKENYKLIKNTFQDSVNYELYDLAVDPAEKNNITEEELEIVTEMTAIMDSLYNYCQANAVMPEETGKELTPEQMEQLRALGYTK